MENIDAIYIINLKFEKKNLQNFFSKLPLCKKKVIIFPAVDYNNEKKFHTLEELEEKITNSSYLLQNIGARGCFLSHYRIYKHIIKKGYNLVLILEDDLIYHPKFLCLFQEMIQKLPKNFGISYLHNIYQSCNTKGYTNSVLKSLYKMNESFSCDNLKLVQSKTDISFGTPGYLINNQNNFIQEFVTFLEDMKYKKKANYDLAIDCLIGCYFNWFYKTSKVLYYIDNPLVFDSGLFLLKSNTQSNYNLEDFYSYNGIHTLSQKITNLQSSIIESKSSEKILEKFNGIFNNKKKSLKILITEKSLILSLYLDILVYSVNLNYNLDNIPKKNINYDVIFGNKIKKSDNVISIYLDYKNKTYLYYKYDNITLYQLLKNSKINLDNFFISKSKSFFKKKLLGIYVLNVSPKYTSLKNNNISIIKTLSFCSNYNFVVLDKHHINFVLPIIYMSCIPILPPETQDFEIFNIVNAKRVLFLGPDIKSKLTRENYEAINKNTVFTKNGKKCLTEEYKVIEQYIKQCYHKINN